ncbi:MAG: dynamin family protein [Burkholderiales bacterium]|nr:dynamin family protein [Burkholderiales bacterium]
MNSVNLVERFQLYSSWRFALGQAITRFRDWMAGNGIADVQGITRIQRLLDRLAEDKLSIAFVAEFSRGKSELINAIFFADYGRRILPSSAGRTTMCPTELLYYDGEPAELRLLPIETRSDARSVAEFRLYPDAWTVLRLDTSSGDAMLEALRQVSQVKRVRVSVAHQLGLFDEKDPDARAMVAADGTVEIPAWRHAVINFPHPLLAQGLVILDTPGLNAIGSEPELTLNLIPNAHAVLFILAADTGVTKSDIQVWREHIGGTAPGAPARGRLAVLNKIDSMWDELKSAAEVEAEIARQRSQVAHTLGLPEANVFPISAQKGLFAKVSGDAALLEKSRLPALERALSEDLIPGKQEIVREFIAEEIRNIIGAAQALLATRLTNLKEQRGELDAVRDKNQDTMHGMLERVRAEKERFERSLMQFSAIRSVLARSTNTLFGHLGMEAYTAEVARTHQAIGAASFSAGMLEAMRGFFRRNRELLQTSDRIVAEITDMMAAMYQRFSEDFRLQLSMPRAFSMARYLKELDRVEDSFNRRFGTLSMITHYERTLTRRFFEVVATRIQTAFEIANRDTEGWLKAVMNPLEGQIKERQQTLKRRLESLKRVHQAADTLEERLEEFAESERTLTTQVVALDNLRQEIEAMLAQDMLLPREERAGFDVSL